MEDTTSMSVAGVCMNLLVFQVSFHICITKEKVKFINHFHVQGVILPNSFN